MNDVSFLNVNLHGERIGTLTNVGGGRTIFTFCDSYIENESRPTLGLFFHDELGSPRTEFLPSRGRVMPFFSNLLPEGHLRKYLADRVGVVNEHEFELLDALGRDMPGAITITPSGKDAQRTRLAGAGVGHRTPEMRFSLSGAQLKLPAVAGEAGNLTIPPDGTGGSWIIKLPSREFDCLPENEFSMMKLAQLSGINVPKIMLINLESIRNLPVEIDEISRSAFAIERFDRLPDGTRVHTEDFSQVFGVYSNDKTKNGSVKSIAKVIAAEGGEEDIIECIRRATFNILIGNADMRLKSWSLIYHNRRSASLSPAYGFISTLPYGSRDDSRMKISRTNAFSGFTVDELTHFAVKSSIPKRMAIDAAKSAISLFMDHWKREVPNLPINEKTKIAIESHFNRIPILREI